MAWNYSGPVPDVYSANISSFFSICCSGRRDGGSRITRILVADSDSCFGILVELGVEKKELGLV